MSILKAAFHENPRCIALINAFSEGVALHAVGQGDRMSVVASQQSNGYELLRQLTLEVSSRFRAEALSLRTQIAGRSFVLTAAHPSSLVSDVIRRNTQIAIFTSHPLIFQDQYNVYDVGPNAAYLGDGDRTQWTGLFEGHELMSLPLRIMMGNLH